MSHRTLTQIRRAVEARDGGCRREDGQRKVAYDLPDAELAAAELTERRGQPFEVYTCPTCGALHVGRKRSPGPRPRMAEHLRRIEDVRSIELGARAWSQMCSESGSGGFETVARRFMWLRRERPELLATHDGCGGNILAWPSPRTRGRCSTCGPLSIGDVRPPRAPRTLTG